MVKGVFVVAVINKNTQAWAEAKAKCRLNNADIQMAKELGMSPKSLLKNIPGPNQEWKSPVNIWIRELYEDKFGYLPQSQYGTSQKNNKKKKSIVVTISDEELPF